MTKAEIKFHLDRLKTIKMRKLAGHPAFCDNGLRKITIEKLKNAKVDVTGY